MANFFRDASYFRCDIFILFIAPTQFYVYNLPRDGKGTLWMWVIPGRHIFEADWRLLDFFKPYWITPLELERMVDLSSYRPRVVWSLYRSAWDNGVHVLGSFLKCSKMLPWGDVNCDVKVTGVVNILQSKSQSSHHYDNHPVSFDGSPFSFIFTSRAWCGS